MKNIKLKSLHIINFKGIKELNLDFETNTTLFGANKSGKTTTADAYRWLLTGMDSQNRSDFEIKPTDSNSKTQQKIENQVTAIFDIDGRIIKLCRVNKEKWVTKKGSANEEFKGNESLFFIDDVPMILRDYQKRVYAEIMDLEQIKVLTDPTFFNLKINWQDRRRVLTDMAGEVTDSDVLAEFEKTSDTKAVDFINEILVSKKAFPDRKKELDAKRKLAKDEKDVIPTRIDEAFKAMPTPLPFERIKEDVNKISIDFDKIDKDISDANAKFESENIAIEGIRDNIKALHSKKFDIENKHTQNFNIESANQNNESDTIKKQLAEFNTKLNFNRSNVAILQQRKDNGAGLIKKANANIEGLKVQKDGLLEQWKAENAKQLSLNEIDCNCPTCKQSLPAGDVENKKSEMLSSFNLSKKNAMEALVTKANNIKAEMTWIEESVKSYTKEIENIDIEIGQNESDAEVLNKQISETDAKLDGLKSNELAEVKSLWDRLKEDTEYQGIGTQIEQLNQSLTDIKTPNNDVLKEQKKALTEKTNAFQLDLAKEDQIKAGNLRIEELKAQEKKLAQEIADYEAEVFAISAFLKVKMEMVQESVNDLFSIVKFRMYKDLIGGGEEACCDCLIDGVEYEKNLNTESRVNGGIDVINALSKHYGLSAPIWIDNRESVTDIIHTDNQVINLVVSPKNSIPSFLQII